MLEVRERKRERGGKRRKQKLNMCREMQQEKTKTDRGKNESAQGEKR